MENNIGNFNKNINLDDPRIDFNKLLCTSVSGEQDSMNPSNSQFQVSSNPEKKATHSEIEKRRRQKMNKHLNELVFHLPMTMTKNKKPDKITILKMAVQHMKNLKASSSILSDSFLCQNYISPFELQSLVLKETKEFLLVIKCDSGRILYASESCSNCIGFQSSDLVDKVFFEIVHPSDSKSVKDQLTYYDQNNAMGGLSSFMLNKTKTFTSGDRRSFVCRIKTGETTEKHKSSIQDHMYTNIDSKKTYYKTVQFVGYLRSDLSSNLKFGPETNRESAPNSAETTNFVAPISPAKLNAFKNFHSNTLLNESKSIEGQMNNQINDPTSPDQSSSSISSQSNANVLEYYLIVHGQITPKTDDISRCKYVSRHDSDGKFIYLEPGAHFLIGYLPHQLISESLFNHVHTDDVNLLKKAFQEITLNSSKNKIRTHEYRFRLENNSFLIVQSVLYALQNPFSGQLEYIVAQNTLCSTPVNYLQKNSLIQSNQQIYQKKSPYINHNNIPSQLINSQTISMPMTPSPEESMFNNDSNYNSDKLIDPNSIINMNEFPNTSKNLVNYQIQSSNMGQKNISLSNYNSNRNLQQFGSSQARTMYQNQMHSQKAPANYTIYNQTQMNPNSPESKVNFYQMVNSNSFTSNFINSDPDFQINNQMYNQKPTQSTNSNEDNWMMQLFDSETNSNRESKNS